MENKTISDQEILDTNADLEDEVEDDETIYCPFCKEDFSASEIFEGGYCDHMVFCYDETSSEFAWSGNELDNVIQIFSNAYLELEKLLEECNYDEVTSGLDESDLSVLDYSEKMEIVVVEDLKQRMEYCEYEYQGYFSYVIYFCQSHDDYERLLNVYRDEKCELIRKCIEHIKTRMEAL